MTTDIAFDAKRTHAEISADMLEHAAQFIEDGDLVQASEKIWGALSHGVRQVADRRGWPIGVNEDQKDVGRYIARLMNDDVLDSKIKSLWEFHVNFYEDTKERGEVEEEGLARAREVCAKLTQADNDLGMLPAPNGPLFRAYQRRWDAKRDEYPSVLPIEYTPDEWRSHYRALENRALKVGESVKRAREEMRRLGIEVPRRRAASRGAARPSPQQTVR